MTLEKTLRQQLSNAEPGGFHVTDDGWSVTLVTDKSDSLSCSLKELTLQRDTPIAEELKPWADRIAQRVTGLMEPLSVIEAWPGRRRASQRSMVHLQWTQREAGGRKSRDTLTGATVEHRNRHVGAIACAAVAC